MEKKWWEERGFYWCGGIDIPPDSVPVVAGELPQIDASCEHYTAFSSIRDELNQKVWLGISSYDAGEDCKKNRALRKRPIEILRCEKKAPPVLPVAPPVQTVPVDAYGNRVDEESLL